MFSSERSRPCPNSDIVAINVGGEIFQTTKHTLSLAGSESLFSKISSSNGDVPFIDRDPEVFSILLSLLRTGNLPSKAKALNIQDLIFEARYYGIESLVMNCVANSSQFDAFNLEKSMILPLNGRDLPTAMSTSPCGSFHVAHGSKLTSYDWSLSRKSTILTQFTAIDSLLALSSSTVAAGATDFSGLQILDLEKGSFGGTLNWENVTKSASTVQAIGASSEYLFTSFESIRRNSNCIMVYDLNNSLNVVTKVGHNEIFGADIASAMPATKLQWLPSHNLLMASGSHSSLSGVSGRIQFWDIRSSNLVLEMKEKDDCFADITFVDALSAMFKVGVNSGEVFFADLRSMNDDISWICVGEERRNVSGKKGVGCRIKGHGSHVFCSKGAKLELWSEVLMNRDDTPENRYNDRVLRRNTVGHSREIDAKNITDFVFGGGRMFLTRKDQQHVEVWTSGKVFHS